MQMRDHQAGYLQNLIDGLGESVMVIGTDYTIMLLNKAAREHAGLGDNHSDQLKCHMVSHARSSPCEGAAHPCPLNMVLRSGDAGTVIHRHKRSDGRWRLMEIMASPLMDKDGRMQAIVESSRDVTERVETEEALKQALREKDVLMDEIHHRVKNNLMVVQSLLRLQSKLIKDKKTRGIFDECESRVRSIGMIHERLYRSDDPSGIGVRGYMHDLVALLMRGCHASPAEIRTHVDVPELTLDIDTMMPCGLIVNELVSNALKHAFKKGGAGELYVGLRALGEGFYELEVRDNGKGLPEGLDMNKTQSLGLQIVSSLVTQLQGGLELERNKGTCFKIRFKERRHRGFFSPQ